MQFVANIRRPCLGFAGSLGLCLGAFLATSSTLGAVVFSINSSQDVHAISPFIYGVNQFNNATPPINYGLQRLGGNRWTGYNWENNASNAGSDFNHVSDLFLTNFQVQPAGGAVAPALQNGATFGNAVAVTVPIAGYVAADTNGTVTTTQVAPSSRWKQVVAKKSTVTADPLTTTPNTADSWVFTDEFANWVETTKQSGQQVFYTLDNEPGLWDNTHPRLHPARATFEELRQKTIAHASAIKDVAPDAIVFGPGGFGWSDFVDLHGAPDATTQPPPTSGGELHFHEWLLQRMATEESLQGRTLLDVLDLHWYPEAQGAGTRITFDGALNNSNAVASARMQAPRSLWDPTYTETSWITGCCSNGPIQLLNRVQQDIDQFKPGTQIGITEYNYGGGNHISGAVAQADVLGILGRENVFAAAWWNVEGQGNTNFTFAAFDMFLNYDDSGSRFGDTSISATTSDNASSAIYASVDANNPNRMVLVAINRTDQPLEADISIEHEAHFALAEVYTLAGTMPSPLRGSDLLVGVGNQLSYVMAARSVSTIVLTTLPGDFNGDGSVDAADYVVWRKGVETVPDGYAVWQTHFGQSSGGGFSSNGAVPEPATLLAALLLLGTTAVRRRSRRRK